MQKRKASKPILILLAICLLSILTACQQGQDREELARAALHDKYERNFEILQVYSQKIGQEYFEVMAADSDGILFTAAIDTINENVSDNYVERIICDAISARIRGNTGIPDVYVNAVGPQPITGDTNISIEEYASLDPLNRFRVDLFLTSAEEIGTTANYDTGLSGITLAPHLYITDEEGLMSVRTYWSAHDGINLDYKTLVEPWEYQDFEGRIPVNDTVSVSATIPSGNMFH